MDKNFPIAFVAISILAIAGCTIGDTPVVTAPAPTETPVEQSPTAAESFNNPVVSTNDTATNASATPNLIQLTNPKERERIVSKGRNDPFAQIIERPVPVATVTRTVPVIPPLPTPTVQRPPTRSAALSTATTTVSNQQAKTPKPETPQTSVLPKIMPGIVTSPTLGSVLPPPVKPELAEGVMVSGVVLIGQNPQAIIKVPNESTSRYVQVGQRLAGGLLIKRIEMNEGSNPIVILEQYGIEVARMVGEQPVNSASSATNVEAS
ncbi:hypothetical protein [Nodularia sp. NIES-3585]|uniref:hypothetical protein n=1 Tax=Nodularia sp. NIES-3585 TaxID=1973477 RepID=UPI000B5C26C6|nr:hypothetical protein [Nodularia sp. NIES-3585]GAX35263.1 hypothetical protein NIES3585_12750 [Nodularia sp. NIES-3585]